MKQIIEKYNILLLFQGNKRSIFIESLIFDLEKRGYNVIFGSLGDVGSIQEYLTHNGFTCYNFNQPRKPLFLYYFKNHRFWKSIIKKHNINLILSHLQWANLVALSFKFFSFYAVKVIPTRHHIDASFLNHSRNAKIEDAIVNLLSAKQVVVSEQAKRFMINNEFFANQAKIFHIPLGYNFEKYNTLNSGGENRIRFDNKCNLLIVNIARLIKTKRQMLLIETMYILINRGLDVKLILLDDGPERNFLEEKIKGYELNTYIKLYGHQKNIIDFIRAADIVVQPSIEESSNQVVKEAGISKKTVIVTKNIGDFNDYIIDKQNGFFINENDSADVLADLIQEIYYKKYNLYIMGINLKNIVKSKFSIENTTTEYIKLF